MRGKDVEDWLDIVDTRITPAYAGKRNGNYYENYRV